MSNPYIDNSERWLALADVDYLTHFVKAWIPFNAWYKNSFPSLKRDRDVINHIKSHSNLFRDRLIALLNGSNPKSIKFKSNIWLLHNCLESNYLPNADKRISLKSIVVERNTQVVQINTIRRWIYKVEIIYSGVTNYDINVIVTASTGATKYTFNQNKFDLDSLLLDVNHSSTLTESQQNALRQTYLDINPQKPINLICDIPRNSIQAGEIFLINDIDKLSKGLIEILYRLRNILFHGELNPSKNNVQVYEPAYNMLQALIQSLK